MKVSFSILTFNQVLFTSLLGLGPAIKEITGKFIEIVKKTVL